MDDKETLVTGSTEPKETETEHKPRPVKPEDESYGELMMRFTTHPVKPKYWFEEFGDHWTCSCGQVNKGETCANCGLERDLLRKLFILHKPSLDGTPPGPPDEDGTAEPEVSAPPLERREPVYDDDDDDVSGGGSHSGLIAGVIIAAILLLLGSGAFVYFVLVPEMQEQDAAKRDSVRMSLCENLPVATACLPDAQYKAYIAAGDKMCDVGKYNRSLTYYNKAADLKNSKKVKKKILGAKYGYVKAHQYDNDAEYFETYLNELMDAKYDGASAIYYSYYAWHVNIVANNRSDDFSTDMKNVNRSDTIYFHTTVTGGPPDDAVRLYYQVIWPDGESETQDIEDRWRAGSHFSTRFQYAMPAFSKTGKLTFEVYDKDSRDLLGSDSITLKK